MEQETHIRIMSYNIHRWTGQDRRLDIDRLADVIRNSGAGLVALNEVLHPVTIAGRESEPLASLAEQLGMTWHFGPSVWQDHGPGWSGPIGNALMSRFPLADVYNIPLPRLPFSKQRSLLGATVTAGPAKGLAAFVTHLDHAFEGTRLTQIRGALSLITHDGPHFISGDFNTPGFYGRRMRRLSPPVLRRMRNAGYEDAFHAAGHGTGRTYPVNKPLFRVDFLFFPLRWSPGLSAVFVPDSSTIRIASDHRPIVADWHLP